VDSVEGCALGVSVCAVAHDDAASVACGLEPFGGLGGQARVDLHRGHVVCAHLGGQQCGRPARAGTDLQDAVVVERVELFQELDHHRRHGQ
jgi:hypothetical protein